MTVEAFPLHWPEGWPRTPSYKQHASRFTQVGWTAMQTLRDELRRLGATNVVISSNVPLRQDGIPYADAARRKIPDPGVAVYFRLKGRPMVMARDAYWTPWENMRSVAATVEAMRALERHGGAFMMERAFSGFTALPSPGPSVRPWREVLGVSGPGTREAIDVAYRAAARRAHPDAGGSNEAMAEVNAARDQALREIAA